MDAGGNENIMVVNWGNENLYGNAEPYGKGYGNSGETVSQTDLKGNGQGFGIASLVLGIISLLLFCTCVNWITGTLAIIFGIIQIAKNREKGFAVAGIVTAGISMLFAVVLYVSMAAGLSAAGMDYRDLYDSYYGGYDYDGYYDNYYDDDDDDYDGYYDDDYDGYYDDYYDGYYDDYYNGYYDDYYDYYEQSGPEFLNARSETCRAL